MINKRFWNRSTLLVLILAICLSSLTACGGTATPQAAEPTAIPTAVSNRGTGGTLRMQFWEAPTILNPHLTVTIQDWEAARITYEPLASYDENGELVAFLAAEIPSLENGVAEDGKSVTWKLKSDVLWSDGTPFTAEDVKFTYEYIIDPAVNAQSAYVYGNVEMVEVLDPLTVKVIFSDVTPAWSLPFVGIQGVILPQHVFAAYKGANAREAPANTLPVGTGPYRVVEPGIKPQEVLLLGTQIVETNKIVYEANPYYREADLPYFSKIELRGGGTASEAARLVLEAEEADYAHNITSLPPDELESLQASGNGVLLTKFGSNVERILLNQTDPRQSTASGERSSIEIPNPFFSDKKVRQAFAYAIDTESIVALYGPLGSETHNNLVAPLQYNSPNVFYTYDPQKAMALLDEAGWTLNSGSNVRVNSDGMKLTVTLQGYAATQGTALEQMQQIVKQNLNAVGVDVNLKIVDASIMFGGDPAENPDSFLRFNADMQMFNISSDSPDPGPYMQFWTCAQIPQQANNWSAGLNIERWCSEAYDDLYRQATTEIDPEIRQQLFIQMNDMLIEDVVMIPLVLRGDVSGVSAALTDIVLTPWDMNTWNIKDWRRTP
ncbi:MAG: peptide ABC transporter substrate-binding protein [Anaerolineae bacterium]|nr:peptide ABC transporter substrate-binding protein [Anaerolineae bacterium]